MAEDAIDRLLSLDNKFVNDTKFIEVKSKGTRTFGISFNKNIAYPQFNYSIAKEIWIESVGNQSKLHIKTRPLIYIWALPILMLPMFPSAIHSYGFSSLLIFIVPIALFEVLFFYKSSTENRLLDQYIDKVLK
ncbi:hypothetical protein ACFSJY_07245 [Thalassotalea euphylliae]|uniref:hypothetical protein n=1 Tax=Thalassotalea euphylliae TaxID=1655234 RepID=UPI00363A8F04